MRKLIAALAALLLLTTAACAENDWTRIDGEAARGIVTDEAGVNRPEKGVSPTTGLPLADYHDLPDSFLGQAVNGIYMPMLVQVDNTGGGVGEYAQWGVQYADILYETPLTSGGVTRLSALFSDVLPDSVGPIRSARVGHVRLAAEWMGGFVHYGGQTRQGSDVNEEMRRTDIQIIRQKNRFDGTDGTSKPWKQFFSKRMDRPGPHDKSANVAALSELVADSVEQVPHAFRFTDELPTAGDAASELLLNISRSEGYSSRLVYQADANAYLRYMIGREGREQLYIERETGEPVTFANVIIQYTQVTYNGSSDAPVMETLGQGNADIFMGGRHIAGCWKHDAYHSRTVFYDAEGREVALQRGHTLISVMDASKEVCYK